MAVSLQSLLEGFAERWPLEGAESWDAPGLVSGSIAQQVSKVLLTVDVTAAVLDHAIETGANLIFAHHPYIMRGVTTLAEETAKGALLARAIRANVSIYAAHTNADIVTDGVSDVIAKALGLQSITALDDTPRSSRVTAALACCQTLLVLVILLDSWLVYSQALPPGFASLAITTKWLKRLRCAGERETASSRLQSTRRPTFTSVQTCVTTSCRMRARARC